MVWHAFTAYNKEHITMKFLNYLNEEDYATISGLTNKNPTCVVYKNPSAKEITLTANARLAQSCTSGFEPYVIRYIAEPKSNSIYIWNANFQIHDYAAKDLGLTGFPNDSFWGEATAKAGKLVPEDDLKCGKNIVKTDFKSFSQYFANVKELEQQYNPKWLVHG
jgi:hypothetical protein